MSTLFYESLAMLLFTLLAGCGRQCFRPADELATFRILGVRAEPLLATEGQPVKLTLATADIHPRDVRVAWWVCLPPDNPDDCLRRPPIAEGTAVTITAPPSYITGDFPQPPSADDASVPPDAKTLDAAMPDTAEPTPQVHLIGFACAGGEIGPPAGSDPSPTCVGNDAQGWVFSYVLYYASLQLPSASNPKIVSVRFGLPGSEVPIRLEAPPTVPRCADRTGCPSYAIEIDTVPSLSGDNVPSDGSSGPAQNSSITVSYLVDHSTITLENSSLPDPPCPTALGPAPAFPPGQVSWMPPQTAQLVHFFIMVRSMKTGGFAWTERRVIVE